MNMQAINKKNFYVIAADHNMKRGPIGYIFKACGVLPLSSSLDASINLNKTIKDILNKPNLFSIYVNCSEFTEETFRNMRKNVESGWNLNA